MDIKRISQYLHRTAALHRLLNSERCPPDMDERYANLHAEFNDIRTLNHEGWKRQADVVSLHDAWVCELSERRIGGRFHTRFHASADLVNAQGSTVEKLQVEIALVSGTRLRELNNKEIYLAVCLPEENLFGVLYHRPQGGMGAVVAQCDHLRRTIDAKAIEAFHQGRELQEDTPTVAAGSPATRRPRM